MFDCTEPHLRRVQCVFCLERHASLFQHIRHDRPVDASVEHTLHPETEVGGETVLGALPRHPSDDLLFQGVLAWGGGGEGQGGGGGWGPGGDI